MRNPDVGVRYETVWALCLHWGHLRTLPMLRAMLEGQEREVEVLIIAARSLGSMVERGGHPDEESFRVLARVALDESADAKLRGGRTSAFVPLPGCCRPESRRFSQKTSANWMWMRSGCVQSPV